VEFESATSGVRGGQLDQMSTEVCKNWTVFLIILGTPVTALANITVIKHGQKHSQCADVWYSCLPCTPEVTNSNHTERSKNFCVSSSSRYSISYYIHKTTWNKLRLVNNLGRLPKDLCSYRFEWSFYCWEWWSNVTTPSPIFHFELETGVIQLCFICAYLCHWSQNLCPTLYLPLIWSLYC